MDIISNYENTPSIAEIEEYLVSDSRSNWLSLTDFLKEKYNSCPNVMYSKCSAKKGWNVKYKYKSKSLCTLYPMKDYFTALIVLGEKERTLFDIIREDFTDYLKSLYDNCTLFNNTKWLMVDVKNQEILNDVKNLIKIRTEK